MQKRLVSGIAFSREEAIILIIRRAQPRRRGRYILGALSEANIEIDMIAQNATNQSHTDFTFTVQRVDHAKALKIVESLPMN